MEPISSSFYEPGDLIYTEKPFAFVIFDEYKESYCDYCSKDISQNERRMQCSKCKYVSYCSENCKADAWSEHKDECARLKYLPDGREDIVRLIGKVILKLKGKNWAECSVSVGNEKRSFTDLISHCDITISDSKLSLLGVGLVYELKMYLSAEDLPEDDQLLEIIGKVRHNKFDIGYGSTFYIGSSIFDHACIPNAFSYFIGLEIKIRATDKIEKGDIRKVTISYSDEFHLLEEIPKYFYGPCKCNDCMIPYGEGKLTKVLDKSKAWEIIRTTENALEKIQYSLNPKDHFCFTHDLPACDLPKCPIQPEIPLLKSLLVRHRNVLGKTHLLHLRLLTCFAGTKNPAINSELLDCLKQAFGEYSIHVRNIYDIMVESRLDSYLTKFKQCCRILYGDDPHPLNSSLEREDE